MSQDRRLSARFALVILVSSLLPASGCIWLAVGGAGYTGYEIAKDDRTLSAKATDARITSSVNAKLAADPEVSAVAINVDTFNGVVTLHGDVKSGSARDRAIALARSVKGVRSVKSNLVVVR